ncbi:GNAT family N-acetyltransferase [Seonamhaeicola maritimus]|uniref:GNAT family N-acetyltransferase n=1 Tax=Seonamhaeicola maritimus TaxID=2591822 RepID=UPI001F4FBCD7|nr:GNAT family N-acetyltransferase [Seonamhaeicola maritimus]
MKSGITYQKALTDDELYQILKLQKTNIISSITEEEKQKEGFVTVQHSFGILKAMNNKCAHSIATHESKVIGYALSMTDDFKEEIEVLKPMFEEIDNSLEGDTSYIVMGQICIHKAYRGQGVFRGLYNFMRQELKEKFDAIITEVDIKNQRSLNAHKAVGFGLLKKYAFNNQDWELIIWEI